MDNRSQLPGVARRLQRAAVAAGHGIHVPSPDDDAVVAAVGADKGRYEKERRPGRLEDPCTHGPPGDGRSGVGYRGEKD